MYDAFKKIEIVDDIKKRVVTFTHVDDLDMASEIARRWFKG